MELSVRAFAELMVLPGYQQERILYEQKHPTTGPAPFRVQYYRPALVAIRRFYQLGNSAQVLQAATSGVGLASQIGNATRLSRNLEILAAFRRHTIARRHLAPYTWPRITGTIKSVGVRVNPDLAVDEANQRKLIYFNCRRQPLDAEIAQLTLELSWLLLQSMGSQVPLQDMEVVDLASGDLYRHRTLRAGTMKKVEGTAKVIAALWPHL